MKERGVLFKAEMIRALLAGTKTQTRRIMKCQPVADATHVRAEWSHGELVATYSPFQGRGSARWGIEAAPYQPGDHVWARETWTRGRATDFIYFKADRPEAVGALGDKWHSPIHLFKKDARIHREVVEVRVERVNEISEEDAEAEGIQFLREHPDADETLTARQLFEVLWDHINGKRPGCAWKDSPWVWAYTLKEVA